MKQINLLLPCVDDSQRSYTSKVQLQYDKPIYNQVLGRLIMDSMYTPVNSKVYRNNCEITRPRYSKLILPVPLPFVISRFQYIWCFLSPQGMVEYKQLFFFQACERAESSKSCNPSGSESGLYFTILFAKPGGIVGSFIHKFLLFVNEQKPSFSNHFSLKTCAIISISQGKVNFIIQTKNLKGESSKSARKTAKVKQNRWLVMSLQQLYNRAVSTAILPLCTVYQRFLPCLQFCFPFLLYESRFCCFSLNFASLVFYLSEKVVVNDFI